MPFSLKLTPNFVPHIPDPHRGFNLISFLSISGIRNSTSLVSQNSKKLSCSINGDNNIVSAICVLKKLRQYGISGVLSYGLLNTVYYLITFLLVWFYVAPVPGRMGYMAAAQRFLKVMAMVWAGSQVTKLVRAGGALALAPFVDRGLSWFTLKFKFESQGKVSDFISLGFHGDCRILFWAGFDAVFGCDSALGIGYFFGSHRFSILGCLTSYEIF
ncbi:hypothetical protein Godav_023965 [Gossypium davidsonii]|uniref:Uncharacterized protein n=1 Tax=Gossypium davidsonii TaxID=34287 RepID=A0A7J8SU85_GOSDV|nr:hypothetical protein [Gossypium davidsonii]